MQEVWKEIEGTNGMYQVSNLGNVKSFTRIKKGGLLKPGRYSNGYLYGKSDRGIPKRSAKNGTQTRNDNISLYSLADR